MWIISDDMEIFLGYSLTAMQKLKCSENFIKDFLIEVQEQTKFRTSQEVIDSLRIFLNDNAKQVVFDGFAIPVEFNMVNIIDLLETSPFADKENKKFIHRTNICLRKNGIVYVKDLYNKTPQEIRNIRNMGEKSYTFFINTLRNLVQP